MKMKGADILINCLLEQGVDTVFGYPGGTVLDIYDALYRNGKLNHILTAHEQGASHAADGYARVTGKVGVCIATSGPGATNLVTGIATAYMDSIPMVAITGNVALTNLGRDSFQEVDIAGITMPIPLDRLSISQIRGVKDPCLSTYSKTCRLPNTTMNPLNLYPSKRLRWTRASLALRQRLSTPLLAPCLWWAAAQPPPTQPMRF